MSSKRRKLTKDQALSMICDCYRVKLELAMANEWTNNGWLAGDDLRDALVLCVGQVLAEFQVVYDQLQVTSDEELLKLLPVYSGKTPRGKRRSGLDMACVVGQLLSNARGPEVDRTPVSERGGKRRFVVIP